MLANFARVSPAQRFASFGHGQTPQKKYPPISFKIPLIFKLFNIYFTYDRLKFLKIFCKILKFYVYFRYDFSRFFFYFCSSGPSKKNLLGPHLDLVRPIGNLIGSDFTMSFTMYILALGTLFIITGWHSFLDFIVRLAFKFLMDHRIF